MESKTIIELIDRARAGAALGRTEVLSLLQAQGENLSLLYRAADETRRENVGDEVFLRGIIEFSNYCRKHCDYCGIRAGSPGAPRYRMTHDEIITVARQARDKGCTTVVLQSGEDPWFTAPRLCELLAGIKAAGDIAITLSIGEWPAADLQAFREAGCDRYLLRFETSNKELFAAIHPDDDFEERLACLKNIRRAGIQAGSGFLIGLPPGDLETIADDIVFATRLKLEMIGCGPFIPHPDTPLAGSALLDDKEVYFKTIALLRLLNPLAHIPATTAFDALFPGGRDLLLTRGANVFMPNLTPGAYRKLYQLYPNKPCVDEEGDQCLRCTIGRISRLPQRTIGRGPGHSLVKIERG